MTIAVGIKTSRGSVIATDSRLTMSRKHQLMVTSDHTQKIFQVNNCLIATAGQYNLKFNHHWLSVKEFLLNFAARHAHLTPPALVTALQQEVTYTNLAANDFILISEQNMWQLKAQRLTVTNYSLIGHQAATEQFHQAYAFDITQPLPDLATSLQISLTDFVQHYPQFVKIGGPIQVAYLTNNA
ncbi:Ntn hydrolase family protein [Loigolactobacillus jiayinensis]|uniref:Uncharacterized protein n=1 Tax=Loigolactobacillus jiayinensis TaxID=2486016 RepID=A0ABW1RED2_9LACO|nr:hypothetical protein [Loigolactobacillus jiayinensis]